MKSFLCFFIISIAYLGFAKAQTASSETQKVALNIVLADELAIFSNSSEITETIFKAEKPDVRFERVIIQVQHGALADDSTAEQAIENQIVEKLSRVLNANEVIEYLIIDTHGSTFKDVDGKTWTKLSHIGNFSGDQVSDKWSRTFAPIKDHFSKNLKFIMNACLVFSDRVPNVQIRVEKVLNFFGAENGSVYGSYLPEMDTFAFETKYAKLKHFLPSKKLALYHFLIGVAAGVTLALVPDSTQVMSPEKLFLVSFGAAQLLHVLRPLFSKFNDLIGGVNRGYVFKARAGKVIEITEVRKMRDIKQSLLLIESNNSIGKSCHAIY